MRVYIVLPFYFTALKLPNVPGMCPDLQIRLFSYRQVMPESPNDEARIVLYYLYHPSLSLRYEALSLCIWPRVPFSAEGLYVGRTVGNARLCGGFIPVL
jgi:hypothetical protein